MNGRTGLTQIIRKAWSGIRRGPKLIKALVLAVYKLGSKSRQSFSLGIHTTVFQAKIYAIIKACIMEGTEMDYKGRNMYVLSNNQAAIKVLYNFQINSKLVWDGHNSLVKLAEHNRVQLIWVLGHMGIDGNETSDQLAREDSYHPFTEHQSALGIRQGCQQ
jgi:ribonuclease HI